MLPEEFKKMINQLFNEISHFMSEEVERVLESDMPLSKKKRQIVKLLNNHPPPVGRVQECISFLLQNFGVKVIKEVSGVLPIVDDIDYACRNLMTLLEEGELGYAITLADAQPEMLECLYSKNPQSVEKLITAAISSGEIYPGLLRACPGFLWLKEGERGVERAIRMCRRRRGREHLLKGLLDIADSLPKELAKRVIDSAIELGKVGVRKRAYSIGEVIFGDEYRRKASRDRAKSIREWASKPRSSPGRVRRKRINELSVEECLERGFKNLLTKPSSALRYAEMALKKGGGDEALFLKANALMNMGQIQRAMAIADELVARKYEGAYPLLAMLYLMENGDVEKALSIVEEGLEIHPESYDIRITYAQLLYFIGDDRYKEIIEELEEENEVRTMLFMATHWMREPPLPLVKAKLEEVRKAIERWDSKAIREVADWFDRFEFDPNGEMLRIVALVIEGDAQGAGKKLKSLKKRYPEFGSQIEVFERLLRGENVEREIRELMSSLGDIFGDYLLS